MRTHAHVEEFTVELFAADCKGVPSAVERLGRRQQPPVAGQAQQRGL